VLIDFTCAWSDTHPENLKYEWEAVLGTLSYRMVPKWNSSLINQDPNILTDEIYSRLEVPPSWPYRPGEEPFETSTESKGGVNYGWIAYACFPFVSLLLICMPAWNSGISIFSQTMALPSLSTVLLGLLFFSHRNNVDTLVSRNMVWLLVGHCLLLGAYLVKFRDLHSKSFISGDTGEAGLGEVRVIVLIVCLLFTLSGLLSLLQGIHNR
jgi:hypothetical protein